MAISERDAALMVDSALNLAAAGDIHGGGETIFPLITDGYGSAYALAAMLAEIASRTAREQQAPGTALALVNAGALTCGPSPIDDLPPDQRFALRFTAAWANRDHETADALFVAQVQLARRTGGFEFIDGLLRLYRMAIETERARTRAGLPNDRLPAPDGPVNPKDTP